MCFYARTDYACGDWKWGNLVAQCVREHRTGESCAAKLSDPFSLARDPGFCTICRTILAKRRRIEREDNNLARWKQDPRRLRATIEKSEAEKKELIEKVRDLESKRSSVIYCCVSGGGKGGSREELNVQLRPRGCDDHNLRALGDLYGKYLASLNYAAK